MVASGALELCYDARIINEYRVVLSRPTFKFDKNHVDYLLDVIQACGHLVSALPLPARLPDLDDEPFLEVALAGKVKYLITGNIKHFPLKQRGHVSVVSPAMFLDIYRQNQPF